MVEQRQELSQTVISQPQPLSTSVVEQTTATPNIADEDALISEMDRILSQPSFAEVSPEPNVAPQQAVRGPAQLTAEIAAPLPSAPPQRPVGRLVGATPDAPKTPVQPKRVTAVEPVNASTEKKVTPQAATPVAQPAASKTQKPVKKAAKRKPEDIVRATLKAQTAAWNEGDLEAFMDAYSRSDELRYVAGGSVTKGWSATMRRYRERYADDRGLGWLAFDDMDVELVTDNVAVVTGRFNRSKGPESTSGAFSYVMKNADGVWRIVHDHSVVDSKITAN